MQQDERDCPGTPHWVGGLLAGSLTDKERRECEEHLAACPRCQDEFNELAPLRSLLRRRFRSSPDEE